MRSSNNFSTPLPLVRQPLAGPLGVGPRILERDPGHPMLLPAFGIAATRPVAEKVDGVLRSVVSGVEKLFELRIGYRKHVDKKRSNLHGLFVEAARGVFPWVLNIDAGGRVAFDLRPSYLRSELAAWDPHHAFWCFGRGLGRWNLDDILRQYRRLMRVVDEGLGRHGCSALH